jgi:hypothetical protein
VSHRPSPQRGTRGDQDLTRQLIAQFTLAALIPSLSAQEKIDLLIAKVSVAPLDPKIRQRLLRDLARCNWIESERRRLLLTYFQQSASDWAAPLCRLDDRMGYFAMEMDETLRLELADYTRIPDPPGDDPVQGRVQADLPLTKPELDELMNLKAEWDEVCRSGKSIEPGKIQRFIALNDRFWSAQHRK